MKNDNLAIISNEKTQQKSNKFLCDNIDLKSIPEGLSEYFDIELFLRKSKIDRESHEINLKKIFLSSGILSLLYKIWSRSKINKKIFINIIIAIYFFCVFIIIYFKKKKFIYMLEVMVTKSTDAIQKFLVHLFIILCLVLPLKYQN